jgi:hypothetical protein
MTSITARLEALEKQKPNGLGVSPKTRRAVFDLVRSDKAAADLLRESCVLEGGGKFRPLPGTSQEVLDVFDRLGVAELLETDAGRQEAVKRLQDEANGRMQRAITDRFGQYVAQRFFPNE